MPAKPTRTHDTHAWAKDASISAFDFSAMPTATLPRKVSKPWRIAAWMVKRGEIGGFGGGWLEQPRRWLGVQ